MGGPPLLYNPPKEEKAPAGDEDVEANLLRPSPCVATLQLRVYRAEDLPQGGTPQNLPFYYFGVGVDLGDPHIHFLPSPLQQSHLGYRSAARGAS